MHLQGVVRGQGDGQAAREEGGEGVAVVVEEQGVVGEGRHAQPDLGQVVQVLWGAGERHENVKKVIKRTTVSTQVQDQSADSTGTAGQGQAGQTKS